MNGGQVKAMTYAWVKVVHLALSPTAIYYDDMISLEPSSLCETHKQR